MQKHHQRWSQKWKPKNSTNVEIIQKLKPWSYKTIMRKYVLKLEISVLTTVYYESFKISKVSARWVPQLLTAKQKLSRLQIFAKLWIDDIRIFFRIVFYFVLSFAIVVQLSTISFLIIWLPSPIASLDAPSFWFPICYLLYFGFLNSFLMPQSPQKLCLYKQLMLDSVYSNFNLLLLYLSHPSSVLLP